MGLITLVVAVFVLAISLSVIVLTASYSMNYLFEERHKRKKEIRSLENYEEYLEDEDF